MTNTKSRGFKIYKIVTLILSVLFWIGVWALFSHRVNLEFLLPSPKATVIALTELAKTPEFWQISGLSLLRILSGILIAVALGTIFAVFTANIHTLDSLLSPLMTVVKATPIASFIILALLWIDRNTLPIFITVLIVLPVVWSNVSAGIRSVDRGLLEVAKIYRFSLGKRIIKIYLPSVMPYFLAACQSALGMAWKAGIAAEVLCTPESAIGTQIMNSKVYIETTELFAWTLAVIILSVIIEKLLIFGLKKLAQGLHVSRKEVSDANA
ncbi:MAG: ABC transporter permease subunit [Clostridia bacterium]|nr:ABC transporter permease subunit [Clostridia bacterium]